MTPRLLELPQFGRLIDMGKFPFLILAWFGHMIWLGASIETPPPTVDPIQSAYNYANLVSTLTDRALWLFFLGLILAIGWYIDRRKEKELQELRKIDREKSSKLTEIVLEATNKLEDVANILERVERKLDK